MGSLRDKFVGKTEDSQKESYSRRRDVGKFRKIYVGLPIEEWQMKEGEHSVDIIPYIAGKKDPNTKEGAITYRCECWVHYGVGLNEDAYLCTSQLPKHVATPCPICEHVFELRKKSRSGNISETHEKELTDEIKRWTPKRRCFYNVWVHDTLNDEKSGVKLFDASHYLFEKPLVEQSKLPRGGGFIPFADPDRGKTIIFTREGTGTNTKIVGLKFDDRDPIPDAILSQAISIDEFIEMVAYEEIEKAFLSAKEDESEDEENDDKKEPLKNETSRFVEQYRKEMSSEKQEAPKYEGDDDIPFDNKQEKKLEEQARPAVTETLPKEEQKPTKVVAEKTPEKQSSEVLTCPVEGGRFAVDAMAFPDCEECKANEMCLDENERRRASVKGRARR